MRTTTASCMAIGALALFAGCAGGSSIGPQLTQSTGSVRAAQELGAQQNPEASLHLKLAQESLAQGQKLADAGEEAAARRALEQAELDAELAIALVKEHRAQEDLRSVDQQLAELQPQDN